MFTKEYIEKEVKDVFGNDVTVVSGVIINEDALTIKALIPPDIEITSKISGLEMIQAKYPEEMLKDKIRDMHYRTNEFLENMVPEQIENKKM